MSTKASLLSRPLSSPLFSLFLSLFVDFALIFFVGYLGLSLSISVKKGITLALSSLLFFLFISLRVDFALIFFVCYLGLSLSLFSSALFTISVCRLFSHFLCVFIRYLSLSLNVGLIFVLSKFWKKIISYKINFT